MTLSLESVPPMGTLPAGVSLMKLPDGTILMHGRAPYDPVKAHEYYLRTRELKGRRKGSPRFTVRSRSGTIELTARELTEQRAYAAKRVNDIKNRLAELSSRLSVLRAEANAKESKSKRKARKSPTAADKSKAARESKQYRQKHRQTLTTKRKRGSKTRSRSKADPVARLEERIATVKVSLMDAVARQRALASATRSN